MLENSCLVIKFRFSVLTDNEKLCRRGRRLYYLFITPLMAGGLREEEVENGVP